MQSDTCSYCSLRPSLCHGSDDIWFAGCSAFDHKKCVDWKWTCLCNPQLLVNRSREVDGFECKLKHSLHSVSSNLPYYIPTWYHKIPYSKPLNLEWVAIPLHAIFKRNRITGLIPVAQTASELRKEMGIGPNTKILVTGVAPDQMLEDFWKWHLSSGLLKQLSNLGISLITVPNFSFFLDSPPLHHRYNRSRILRVAEHAAEAGLDVVLHLNVLHEDDWKDWENLLLVHPEIRHLCLEFQTGYLKPENGDQAFNRLIALQKHIGSSISPILIGGGRYASRLGAAFASSTMIDAQPYMHTVGRKMCRIRNDGAIFWHFRSSQKSEPLDQRFYENLQIYSVRLGERLKGIQSISPQGELKLRVEQSGKLKTTKKQKSVTKLPLFAECRMLDEQAPDSEPLENHEHPTASRALLRRKVAAVSDVPRVELVATLSNSRHKSNLSKPPPNACMLRNKGDAMDGRQPLVEARQNQMTVNQKTVA